MRLVINGYLSSKDMDFDAAILKFYHFMEEARKISPFFSNMYFEASSYEEAMQNPLPEEKDAFCEKIREQTKSFDLGSRETVSRFYLFHPIERYPDGYRFMSVGFTHKKLEDCLLTITFVRFDADEIGKSRDKFDKIYATIIDSFPVLYILERFVQKDYTALTDAQLRIGWSICANTEDMGRIKDFPSYEIAPGFTKVLSVVDVFDPSNPVHMERAKALEKEVASNRNFVKKTNFWVLSPQN